MASLSFCIYVLEQLIFGGACWGAELAEVDVSTVTHDVGCEADAGFAVKCDVANVGQANIVGCCVHNQKATPLLMQSA